jgi:hypothetical protein
MSSISAVNPAETFIGYPIYYVTVTYVQSNNNNAPVTNLSFWVGSDTSTYMADGNTFANSPAPTASSTSNLSAFLGATGGAASEAALFDGVKSLLGTMLAALPSPTTWGFLADGITPVEVAIGSFTVQRFDVPVATTLVL